ncbi:MAG: OmpA family protein [Rickettsiales bacterium]|jgi:peptidoglycan-associated lipoprotein|nr:OmpA family protein [Rickettsiales bacterium]
MKVSTYAMLGAALALSACGGSSTITEPADINNQKVFFAFDSAEIGGEAKDNLLGQSLYLKNRANEKIQIAGNCDERGTQEYNLALGVRRANAAKQVLVKDGIDAKRIKTVSYGKNRPSVKGTGESVWKQNRNATTTAVK